MAEAHPALGRAPRHTRTKHDRNGGGNVHYVRDGGNVFWVETYRDEGGALRQRTALSFAGR